MMQTLPIIFRRYQKITEEVSKCFDYAQTNVDSDNILKWQTVIKIDNITHFVTLLVVSETHFVPKPFYDWQGLGHVTAFYRKPIHCSLWLVTWLWHWTMLIFYSFFWMKWLIILIIIKKNVNTDDSNNDNNYKIAILQFVSSNDY